MGCTHKRVIDLVVRFVSYFIIGVPIIVLFHLLFLNVLPRYLLYMEPMPIRQIIIGAIFVALIVSIMFAIVPPERLGQAMADGFYKLVKALTKFAKKRKSDSRYMGNRRMEK